MSRKRKTPVRANGSTRPVVFGMRGALTAHDFARLGAKLDPHAIAIVGIVVSANWAVVKGTDPYLAYIFAGVSILSYMILAFRGGHK